MTLTSSTGTKADQRRTLIGKTYKRNTAWNYAQQSSHTVEINLDNWAVPQHQITLEGDNYPYLKMALVDKYLDSLD